MNISDLETRLSDHTPALQGAAAGFAVLVPLIQYHGKPHLLFEVRADTLTHQPGEVCFPGGKMEAGETPVQCAVRETVEELGLAPHAVRPFAALDFLYHHGGALLHPILAEVDAGAIEKINLNRAEVKETFLVPLSFFLNTRPMLYTYRLTPQVPEDFPYDLIGFPSGYAWKSASVDVPIYVYENHTVWGLTGRICMDLARALSPQDAQRTVHPIAPVWRGDSRILILGSFPSVLSRKERFFYGHPQNRFWRVLSQILGEPVPASIDEKRRMLLAHHIALWDVVALCTVSGSEDSSIRDVIANDIRPILKHANIEQIYANGQTAGKLYRKHIAPQTGRDCTVLPSTSPANAAYSLERLTALWRDALPDGL